MTSSADRELIVLRQRIHELEAIIGCEHRRRTFLFRPHTASAFIGALLFTVATSLIVGAQAPATSSDLEQRVRALEGMLRRGPGNAVQVNGPFEVLAAGGRTILRVDVTPNYTVPVSIGIVPNRGGGYVAVNDSGTPQAVMSATSGRGEFAALDSKLTTRATLLGTGAMVVFDPNGTQLAGVTPGDNNNGRIAIWRGDNKVVDLTSDLQNEGAGLVSVNDASGRSAARLSLVNGAGELVVSNTSGVRLARLGTSNGAGAVSVMNTAGKAVAGLLTSSGGGVMGVAAPAGGTVAEMSVSGDGRGLFQVFARGGGRPLAVLTQATDRTGGLVQISNSSTSVANLTVGSQGGGYLQLANPSGQPTVEAGTLPNGNGQVRAGPVYKCLPVQAATPVLAVGLPDCIVGGQK